MKKSESQMQKALAESLQASLTGLSEKHAKKLQKTVASAAKRIAHKFARLLAKEHKASKAIALPPVSQKTAKAAKPRASKPAPQLTGRKKTSVATPRS